jgi:general secretion pathway protein K
VTARRERQRGAALLTAMVIVTLVATLAAAMVWQQWRAVQVEAGERARMQAAWILSGAIDWARLILREDARSGSSDSLDEPWATPLAETPLSTFLSVDKENTDDAPEAFLSGVITDAQARYNLANVFNPETGKVAPAELAALARLCTAAGVSAGVAQRLADGLAAARAGAEDAPLLPRSVRQLGWLGVDAETVRQLASYLVILPARVPINLNTASKEVIAAATGMDAGDAERLVQVRQQTPFRTLADAKKHLPPAFVLSPNQAGVGSQFFEVRGQLRLGDRVLQERSLVQRRNPEVVTIQRERVSLNDAGS